MSGGGKGGSQTTQVQIPEWLEEGARRNIAKAEDISQTGFVPYSGPDIAALTPLQQSAMLNTGAAASAYGLGSSGPMAGMPQSQNFGGVQGYSSFPIYEQALAELEARSPAQFAQLNAPFIDPVTGEKPGAPYMTGAQQEAAPDVPSDVDLLYDDFQKRMREEQRLRDQMNNRGR